MRDTLEFFRQFRRRFETTGAVAPSSRFLARAMTRPLAGRCNGRPIRVLEVGPGTGAVTRRIVRLLGPEDRFDLVELNETFAGILERRFRDEPEWRRASDRARIHVCPIQGFQPEGPYDFVVSGLPLNNFPSGLVREIMQACLGLLVPGGALSLFEYMYVRPIRRIAAGKSEKSRLGEIEAILQETFASCRFRRDWVFANIPPAWVQHLRRADGAVRTEAGAAT